MSGTTHSMRKSTKNHVSVHNLSVSHCTKHFQMYEATDQRVKPKIQWHMAVYILWGWRGDVSVHSHKKGRWFSTSQIAMQFRNTSLFCYT